MGEAGGSWWYSLARAGRRPAAIASTRPQVRSHDVRNVPGGTITKREAGLAVAFGRHQLAAGNAALVHAKEDAEQHREARQRHDEHGIAQVGKADDE